VLFPPDRHFVVRAATPMISADDAPLNLLACNFIIRLAYRVGTVWFDSNSQIRPHC
jgi:hypothetical protein